MTHYIMRDESRHVAFGVLSLEGFYKELNEREMREREEFTYEGCRLMRDRLLRRRGLAGDGPPGPGDPRDRDELRDHARVPEDAVLEGRPELQAPRALLSPWLRERFNELDILQFEHLESSLDEASV